MPQRPPSEKQIEARKLMGRRVRELREKSELSLAGLAQRISQRIEGPLDRQTVAAWEWTDEKEARGASPKGIPSSLIPDVAASLGVSVEALTGQAAAGPGNPQELALERLKRKLLTWRVLELSNVPTEPLRKSVDAILTRHKDAKGR